MIEMHESTAIAGSPDQLWAALSDFAAISRWAPDVDHSCLTTTQREGVGATRRVQVGRNALLEEIVEWRAGERLGYRIDGLPPVVRSVVNTWSLEGQGDRTIVTLTTQIETGPRPPQQIPGRVFAKVMAKASVGMLAGLKQHIEHADITSQHSGEVVS